MTDERLDDLVSMRKLRDQAKCIIADMNHEFFVKIITGNGHEMYVIAPMQEEFLKFIQNQYDRARKEFDDA